MIRNSREVDWVSLCSLLLGFERPVAVDVGYYRHRWKEEEVVKVTSRFEGRCAGLQWTIHPLHDQPGLTDDCTQICSKFFNTL